MKKYYIDVYFSGTKRVEIFADNGEEAVRLAEKEVLKEDSDIDTVEGEVINSERIEDTTEYADMILDEQRGN